MGSNPSWVAEPCRASVSLFEEQTSPPPNFLVSINRFMKCLVFDKYSLLSLNRNCRKMSGIHMQSERTHTHNPCQNHADVPISWRRSCMLPPVPMKGKCSGSAFQSGNSEHRWDVGSAVPPACKSHLSKAHLKILWQLPLPWKHLLRRAAFVCVCVKGGGLCSPFFCK